MGFGFVVSYLLLSSPSVISFFRLGYTSWYPATGFVIALLLGISPRYWLLAAFADFLTGAVIYHQPPTSWTETLGALGGTGCYAIAGYVLRGPFPIDLDLPRRLDVFRYIGVTLTAALGATAFGVAALAADHTITWNQFWPSAASWYAGDTTALIGFAPFLLIYVIPIVKKGLAGESPFARDRASSSGNQWRRTSRAFELTVQMVSIPVMVWIIFAGPLAEKQLYYLAFLPVIWIAIRHGIRRVATALVIFNFGIVITLKIFTIPTFVTTKVGFLMLVGSGVGLAIGATVTERYKIGQDLGERTMYLNSLIENTPLGIVVHDRTGRVHLCNDAFESLFLYSREELLGNNIDSFIVPPADMEESRQFVRTLASGKRIDAGLQRIRKDGTVIDVELHAVPLLFDREVRGTIAIYADVTKAKQVELRLREQAEILRRFVLEFQVRTNQTMLLNEIGEWFQSCDTITDATSVVSDYGGRLFPAVEFGALYLFKPSRNALELQGNWGKLDGGNLTFVPDSCWALRKGKPHWSKLSEGHLMCSHLKKNTTSLNLCIPMMARGEALGILLLQYDETRIDAFDLSSQDWRESQKALATSVATQAALSLAALRLRESLRDQSVRDPLTGLFNRRFMQESLDRELLRATRKSRPISVIFLDIDSFKRFNDVFGHAAGDSVLCAVAELMRSFCRADDVLCRFGGEEFILILTEATEEEAATRMNQFREKVKRLALHYRGNILDPISVSVGIATFPKNGSSAEALLRAADQAMYESKTQGRDRVSVATP